MAAEAPFTVRQALAACGVLNEPPLFEGLTEAQSMATDLFNDSYQDCIDKTYSDIDDDLRGYSALTPAQGRIRLSPNVKKNIKGLYNGAAIVFALE